MEKVREFDFFDDADFGDALGEVDALMQDILPSVDDPSDDQLAALFADFLDARLANMGWSAEKLADKTELNPDLIHMILMGILPASELDGDLLRSIGSAIGYQERELQILLGRGVRRGRKTGEASRDVFADYQSLLEDHLRELRQSTEKFVHELKRRMEPRRARRRHDHHEFTIQQIEMFIAQHEMDVKLVEVMIDELKSIETPSAGQVGEPTRHDIRRIIHYIEAR